MPSPALRSVVADSNVLLAAVARRAAWRVFENAPDLVIATTEVAIEEMHEHAEEFADLYELDIDVFHASSFCRSSATPSPTTSRR